LDFANPISVTKQQGTKMIHEMHNCPSLCHKVSINQRKANSLHGDQYSTNVIVLWDARSKNLRAVPSAS